MGGTNVRFSFILGSQFPTASSQRHNRRLPTIPFRLAVEYPPSLRIVKSFKEPTPVYNAALLGCRYKALMFVYVSAPLNKMDTEEK